MIEPELDDMAPPGDVTHVLPDAHSLMPDAVLHLVARLRTHIGRIRVVGCEQLTVGDGMGLGEPVAGAFDEAVRVVRRLVNEALAQPAGRG